MTKEEFALSSFEANILLHSVAMKTLHNSKWWELILPSIFLRRYNFKPKSIYALDKIESAQRYILKTGT